MCKYYTQEFTTDMQFKCYKASLQHTSLMLPAGIVTEERLLPYEDGSNLIGTSISPAVAERLSGIV